MVRQLKYLASIMVIIALCGCSSGHIPLLNYSLDSLWGTPDIVTVKKGDTLYSISRRYDVPLRKLIETNNLRPPYSLRIGQRLKMPSTKTHVVSKGDTLYSISKHYNVDMRSLSKANDLNYPYSLSVGQKLSLPDSVVTKKSATNYVSNKPIHKKYSWKKNVKRQSYSTPVKKRNSKFVWPVKGKVISKYGFIGKGRNNDGINIKAPLGTAVNAADGGSVAYAGNELKGFGNLILIKHSGGWVTAYAHNDRLMVKKGQKVRKGEKIATVGSTGGVDSPQLHFEIRAGKKAVNPLNYLQ